MPTNLLREANPETAAERPAKPLAGGKPRLLIKIGRTELTALLQPTEAAARIWAALPMFTVGETWGQSIHFELPVPGGRERGARLNAVLGEIYFWAEEERIIIPFGPTPISGPNEIRLPRPCNVLGRVLDLDTLAKLTKTQPGTKVSLKRG